MDYTNIFESPSFEPFNKIVFLTKLHNSVLILMNNVID
jgi:hypothetical protein